MRTMKAKVWVRRRLAVWIVAPLLLGVITTSCGGARSNAGSSATDCISSVTSALSRAPLTFRLLGVRLLGHDATQHLLRSHTLKGGPFCVVGFREISSTHGRALTVLVLVYSESGSFVSQRTFVRSTIHLGHLI